MRRERHLLALCVASVALWSATTVSAVDPALRCEVSKLKTAGKYDFCRLKAEATAAKTGAMPDFSNCDSAYLAKWAQAEIKAGGMCSSNGDQATVQAFISQHTNALGVALAGAPLPDCGNGVIDPGEQCDQSNLNGQTCASQGFVAGVLKCGAGCMLDTSGCSATRFVDNGDGTVIDLQTGLMWEKKTPGECVNLVGGHPIACLSDADCTGNGGGGLCPPCLHCVNATYTWCSVTFPNCTNSTDPPDGTAFTTFLYGLNGGTSSDGTATSGCFTGRCDWRLPTIEELNGIHDFGAAGCGPSSPCIDPTFGPTQADLYWSATTEAGFIPPGVSVWVGFFGDNMAPFDSLKDSNRYVRAVRGGS